MGPLIESEYVYWGMFGTVVDKLVDKIKESKIVFDGVYGIPRGGLILAVSLSHKLNLPYFHTENQISNKTLVCDDISDTGETLLKFKNTNKIVTIYSTLMTKTDPDFYELEKTKDWVVFPWEK